MTGVSSGEPCIRITTSTLQAEDAERLARDLAEILSPTATSSPV